MKIKIQMLILLFTSINSYSQNCISAISEPEFIQRYNQVAVRSSDETKLTTLRMILPGRCFMSVQVKKLCELFANDYYRYQFATEVYPSVLDKPNFYDVFDAFVSYSAVFRLNEFVHTLPAPLTNDYPLPVRNEIVYPICSNYNGKKGCNLPMADNDFDFYTKDFYRFPTDENRMMSANNIMIKNCISMSQLMKLAMTLDLESNRLFFMKKYFAGVYDMGNYNYATAVFTNEPYKNDWLTFASALVVPKQIPPPPPPVVRCEVKADELSDIKNSINKETVSRTQLALAKQIISTKKCFTCSQIKQIISLMMFEDNKLDLAKYAYDYCTDKENYYTINEAFSFTSSKEDLLDFIKSRK